MKKFLAILSGVTLWSVMGSQVLAMCIWFVPPGRTFEPARDIKTLVVQDGDNQTLVVQPQFSGTATDFGLVMPFPSQPEVDEAPRKIFTHLEDLTNPLIEFDDGPFPVDLSAGLESTADRGVEVIEQRDVGEYTATTLTATDSTALNEWLEDNGYEITQAKQDILDTYIEDGTAFFVALKINIAEAETDSNGLLLGELDPMQFTFSSSDVMLPLRLMADTSGDIFDLLIYTISQNQLYVPGAELQFARKVTARDIKDAPSLDKYNPQGLWLSRNSVSLDVSRVEKDLTFFKTPADVVVEVGDESVRVNPDLLDSKTGLIEATTGTIRYVEEDDSDDSQPTSALEDDQTRPLIVITVLLGIANIFLLNTVLKQRTAQEIKSGRKK